LAAKGLEITLTKMLVTIETRRISMSLAYRVGTLTYNTRKNPEPDLKKLYGIPALQLLNLLVGNRVKRFHSETGGFAEVSYAAEVGQ
jgi:hypothetical protein